MRIVCQQTILMKYHALLVIFEKAAKFEIGREKHTIVFLLAQILSVNGAWNIG